MGNSINDTRNDLDLNGAESRNLVDYEIKPEKKERRKEMMSIYIQNYKKYNKIK